MTSAGMKFWGNLIGYQIVWFSAVIGAGRGLWLPGVSAAIAFAILHFSLLRQPQAQRTADLRLMAVALVCGLIMDGGLARSGLADYAADPFPLPPGSPPAWILSIWGSFALTLRHSMTFLLGRPLIALLLGAVGGPLAYLGAARGWDAIAFAEPRWMAILALVIGWAIAIPLLTTLALRWSSATITPNTPYFSHFPLVADTSQSDAERPATVDPEGGAHDVRRFSTRQDAASKNPGHLADGRFASAQKSFLWLLSLRQRK